MEEAGSIERPRDTLRTGWYHQRGDSPSETRLHVDESARLRAAEHYDLRHIESNQIYRIPAACTREPPRPEAGGTRGIA
jgi:hypothetical protein